MTSTLLFSIMTCYIYGVQKVCDDIHFTKGSQPQTFWKVTWYFLPLVLAVCLYGEWDRMQTFPQKLQVIHAVIMMTLFLPLPIYMGVEFVRYIQAHNVAGEYQFEL